MNNLIVCDLGGVVVDESRFEVESELYARTWASENYSEFLKSSGANLLSESSACRNLKRTARRLVEEGYPFDVARTAASKLYNDNPQEYYRNISPNMRLLHEMQKLRAGFKLILAGNQHEEMRRWIKEQELEYFADEVILDLDLGVAKPSPAFFSRLAEMHPEAHVLCSIGDRIDNDIIPSRQAGYRAFRYHDGGEYSIQTWSEFGLAAEQEYNFESVEQLVTGILLAGD